MTENNSLGVSRETFLMLINYDHNKDDEDEDDNETMEFSSANLGHIAIMWYDHHNRYNISLTFLNALMTSMSSARGYRHELVWTLNFPLWNVSPKDLWLRGDGDETSSRTSSKYLSVCVILQPRCQCPPHLGYVMGIVSNKSLWSSREPVSERAKELELVETGWVEEGMGKTLGKDWWHPQAFGNNSPPPLSPWECHKAVAGEV